MYTTSSPNIIRTNNVPSTYTTTSNNIISNNNNVITSTPVQYTNNVITSTPVQYTNNVITGTPVQYTNSSTNLTSANSSASKPIYLGTDNSTRIISHSSPQVISSSANYLSSGNQITTFNNS